MNMKLLFSMEEINMAEKLNFSDALGYGAVMVLIGMLTVFSVLCIIMLSLFAFKYFFHDLSGKKASAPIKETITEAPVAAVSNQDEEIIAAIAAAIAMAESESDGIKFRVVSFKRR